MKMDVFKWSAVLVRLLVGRLVSVIIQSEIFFRMDFADEVSAAGADGVGAAVDGGSMHAVRRRRRNMSIDSINESMYL